MGDVKNNFETMYRHACRQVVDAWFYNNYNSDIIPDNCLLIFTSQYFFIIL